MLAGSAQVAFDTQGLDFDLKDQGPMNAALAQKFRESGYTFCVRYIPRDEDSASAAYDLHEQEARFLLDEQFALMVVQHYNPHADWAPNAAEGTRYGRFGAQWARSEVGLPQGVSVFLDLEAMADRAPQQDIIDYCLAWQDEVRTAGYRAGLYCGDASGVGGKTIAAKLGAFSNFWLACTEDFVIPGRAFHMQQFDLKDHPQFYPDGVDASVFDFQADLVTVDAAGDCVRWLAPI